MSQASNKQSVTGIQQIGVGVKDLHVSKLWYKKYLGMGVKVFDDKGEAPLMVQYTGDKVHSRHALLTLNIAGGGGMEVWQYVSRTPQPSSFIPEIGDLGIFAAKIKSDNVAASYQYHTSKNLEVSPLYNDVNEKKHYWLKDIHGNLFNIVQGDEWFRSPVNTNYLGGVYGAVIGVSNIENALKLYRDVLGINKVMCDVTGHFDDLPDAKSAAHQYRRVVIRKRSAVNGAFSKLIGGVEIELVQVLDRKPKKIFENRYWGDLGFIHLCFDVTDMNILKEQATQAGFPFTIDSANSFSMGQASGRFAYLEDPDQSLIELVETHKVPILKKLDWYLDIRKRGIEKPLPNWMISCMALSKVK